MGVEVERVTPIDEMIEYALEELMAGGEDGRRRGGLVRHMCLKFPPSEPALSLVFALTSAGAMIEDNLVRDGESGGDVAPLWPTNWRRSWRVISMRWKAWGGTNRPAPATFCISGGGWMVISWSCDAARQTMRITSLSIDSM